MVKDYVTEKPCEVHENAIDTLAKGNPISTDKVRIETEDGEEIVITAVASGQIHIKRERPPEVEDGE